tara:strand:+ start:1356 stop:1655 length:300 start_codon:yes stop_codon:yes gene_type:complete
MRGKKVRKIGGYYPENEFEEREICLSLPEGKTHVVLEKHWQEDNGNIVGLQRCPNERKRLGCWGKGRSIQFAPQEIAHIRNLIAESASERVQNIDPYWG